MHVPVLRVCVRERKREHVCADVCVCAKGCVCVSACVRACMCVRACAPSPLLLHKALSNFTLVRGGRRYSLSRTTCVCAP